MRVNSRRFVNFLIVTSALLWGVMAQCNLAIADSEAKEILTDNRGRTVPLQQVMSKERLRGPILVAIPVAYVFGLGTDRSPLYCSPSVRAANDSNSVVEELVLGVRYSDDTGQQVGSSFSRFTNVKVKRLESHFFNQLESTRCTGISGLLTVVRCVYVNGEDCSKDVRAVEYGAIPLRLKSVSPN